jgi:hypothetical protein
MDPVAVHARHCDCLRNRVHAELELLVRLQEVHLRVKKPVELFTEQLVWALCTASRDIRTHCFLPARVTTARA